MSLISSSRFVVEFAKLHFGLLLVFMGVAGEGIEILLKLFGREWFKQHELLVELTGAISWAVLVLGLCLEFVDAAKSDNMALELQQQIERAKTSIVSLEPRRLNGGSQFELANVLRINDQVEGNNVRVLFPEGDAEAQQFAQDIVSALADGHMHLVHPKGLVSAMPVPYPGIRRGLYIGTNPFEPSQLAKQAVRAFEAAGVKAEITYPFNMDINLTNTIDVLVGSKLYATPSNRSPFSEIIFDGTGRVMTDWDNGGRLLLKENGIHLSANGNLTRVKIDFNRRLDFSPILRHFKNPFFESLGQRDSGSDLSWNFDMPTPISETKQTNWNCHLLFAY